MSLLLRMPMIGSSSRSWPLYSALRTSPCIPRHLCTKKEEKPTFFRFELWCVLTKELWLLFYHSSWLYPATITQVSALKVSTEVLDSDFCNLTLQYCVSPIPRNEYSQALETSAPFLWTCDRACCKRFLFPRIQKPASGLPRVINSSRPDRLQFAEM